MQGVSGLGNGSGLHLLSIPVTAVLNSSKRWGSPCDGREVGGRAQALTWSRLSREAVESASLEVFKRCVGVMDLAPFTAGLDDLRELFQLNDSMKLQHCRSLPASMACPAWPRGLLGRGDLWPWALLLNTCLTLITQQTQACWEGEASVSSPKLPSEFEKSLSGVQGLCKGPGAFRNRS